MKLLLLTLAALALAGCDGNVLSFASSTRMDGGTGLEPGAIVYPGYGDRYPGTRVVYPAGAFVEHGGPMINIKSPPAGIQAAVGDGVHDDTAAFQDAFDFIKDHFVAGGNSQGFWIYLPDGTYLVHDTLIYRGDSLETPTTTDWYDIVQVRFVGESRSGTIIRLADASPGYQDPAHPKMLLAYQHPDTRFNNIAAGNQLARITLDVGSGNPGAVGLFFQGANGTSMTDVTVRSRDGSGAYGIWFKIGSIQGAYHDVTVEGFQYGLYQNVSAETDESFEYLTLRNQQVAGARASGGSMTLRAISVEEASPGVTGILVDSSGPQVAVVDSHLVGHSQGTALMLSGTGSKQLFVRNTSVYGFGQSLVNGQTQLTGDIAEYVSSPVVTLFPKQPTTSFALPVLDTPQVPFFDPSEWTSVNEHGAQGDGQTDDTAAIQAALNSGSPVVYFPSQKYHVTRAFSVPASVQRIQGFGVSGLAFNITEASEAPVLIRDVNGYGGVALKSDRSVVMQDTSGGFSNPALVPQHIFLENVTNNGAAPTFTVAGQRTFARGINDENTSGTADIYAAGGALWVLNYKTENKPVPAVYAAGGALVEVLGGYVNVTRDPAQTPMIINEGANVSYLGTSNLRCGEWNIAIQETRGGVTHTALTTDLPSRGFSKCFMVPLYVGYDPTAVAKQLAALK